MQRLSGISGIRLSFFLSSSIISVIHMQSSGHMPSFISGHLHSFIQTPFCMHILSLQLHSSELSADEHAEIHIVIIITVSRSIDFFRSIVLPPLIKVNSEETETEHEAFKSVS